LAAAASRAISSVASSVSVKAGRRLALSSLGALERGAAYAVARPLSIASVDRSGIPRIKRLWETVKQASFRAIIEHTKPGAREFFEEADATLIEEDMLVAGGGAAPKLDVPPVILCERHYDPTHPNAIGILLPFLQAEGYRAVAWEFDQSIGRDEMVGKLHAEIDYRIETLDMDEAEDRRDLGLLKNKMAQLGVLRSLPDYGMVYQGVDADVITLRSDKAFLHNVELVMDERDAVIAKNLEQLIRDHKGGVIGCIGAAHAEGVKHRLGRRLTKDIVDQALFIQVAEPGRDKSTDRAGVTYIERPDTGFSGAEAARVIHRAIKERKADMVRAEESAAVILEDVSAVCYRVDELKRNEGRQ
jgi:hypothetical protein